MSFFEFDNDQKSRLSSYFNSLDNNLSEYATRSCAAIRKRLYKNDYALRTEFGVDIDKILHNALYNRYVDKTQVFSFYKNDDLTRRALHVQLVARISKIIGQALNLNLDLIEAIALGHDIGHTPFGHKGEQFLSELYHGYTGRFFTHNAQSVRNLMIVTNSNLTLQTYDGILCHCGEKAFEEYYPNNVRTFKEFLEIYEKCYTDEKYIDAQRPSTLEGCVVRISDMIAYIAKDRQDASKAGLHKVSDFSKGDLLGRNSIGIVNNIIRNIVKNSLDKPYIKMDKEVYDEICKIKDENTKKIYANRQLEEPYYQIIRPMMKKIYNKMREDVEKRNIKSPIFQHHLNHPVLGNCYRVSKENRQIKANPDDIVVDYIASMTDDYFLDLFAIEFPEDKLNRQVRYVPYF